MPPLMLRPSLSAIAAVLLGSILSDARAAEPPPCPSQLELPVGTAGPAGAPAAAGNAPAGNAPTAQPGSTGTVGGPTGKSPAGSAPAGGAPDNRISVTSDRATLGVDGNATLQGNVEVRQGNRVIRSSEVQYDARQGALSSTGHIEYDDPLVHVTGAGGSYSAASGADFKSAQFELHQRAARGAARDLELTPQGVVRLKGVTFTTCPVNNDDWQLKADSITLDTRSKIGTGRDAQVDFLGVPLVYLPWVSFPLSSERKSGFLFPSIGNTSTSGAMLAVPYYWNIAPNADFTFQPVEYSKRGADLGGDLRFLTQSQHGELQWNYLPDDPVFHGTRSRVQLDDVIELPADFRLSLDAQNVSDDLYFQDFSQSPEGTSTAFLERRATLSYRDEHWSIEGEAQQYQTIDTTLLVDERPYARMPRLAVSGDYTLGGILHYGFVSEVVNFEHAPPAPGEPLLPSGWRTDVAPGVSLDLTGAGYFLRPAFSWRETQYQLDNTAPGAPRSPSRSLPMTSLDSGLVFERDTGSRDQRTLTLEPRLLYLDVPYRNQNDLPVFDTALPDLNPVELFRSNRYVGADRVSDANQLSWGVTSRLLDALDGRQFLAATFGQTYYFETPRVTLPGETPITADRSDIVATVALTAFQHWGADVGVQWDTQNERSERTQLNLQYKPANDAVVNLGYRYERFQQVPEFVQGVQLLCNPTGLVPGACDLQGFDQVDLSAAWPIRRNWHVFMREVYDLRNHEQLETFGGFEYRACCWRLRLGARRYVSTFTGSYDTGVWLQLELAGLAGVGSASDTSLSEEIRGYTPAEANIQRIRAP
jgi:LPS-assembly protein